MSLNIKNERAVALVRELAAATGESQTRAVEETVRERLERVTAATRADASAERLASARAIIKDIHDSMTDGDRVAIRAAQDSERYPDPSGWVSIPVSSYTVTR